MSAAVAEAVIPDGAELLGVWDCNDQSSAWWTTRQPQMRDWAKAHIERVNDTVRLDFYLLDGPFAVAYRVRRDEDGKLIFDQSTQGAVTETAVQPLAELPPEHLLRR